MVEIRDLKKKLEECGQIQDSNELQTDIVEKKLREAESNLAELLQEKDKFLEDIIQKDETVEKLQALIKDQQIKIKELSE